MFFSYIPRNVDQISIELFDEKSFTDDDLIAFVKYPLSSQIFEGNYRDEWLPLSGKLGEQKEGSINIKLSFTVFFQYFLDKLFFKSN